jgi:hypothetical protein
MRLDLLLQTIARNLWLWEVSDCEITIAHAKGKLNHIADLLSSGSTKANLIPSLLDALPISIHPSQDNRDNNMFVLFFQIFHFPPRLQ